MTVVGMGGVDCMSHRNHQQAPSQHPRRRAAVASTHPRGFNTSQSESGCQCRGVWAYPRPSRCQLQPPLATTVGETAFHVVARLRQRGRMLELVLLHPVAPVAEESASRVVIVRPHVREAPSRPSSRRLRELAGPAARPAV